MTKTVAKNYRTQKFLIIVGTQVQIVPSVTPFLFPLVDSMDTITANYNHKELLLLMLSTTHISKGDITPP